MSLPEVVYHYTDQAGLMGILGYKTIWCTHFAYLNDSSELVAARDRYAEMLQHFSENPEDDERMADYAGVALYRIGTIGDIERQHIFVSSFTSARDDLSQWRGYTVSGSRFAIGFRTEQLVALAATQNGSLKKVTYERNGSLLALRKEFTTRMKVQAKLMWAGPEYRDGVRRPAMEGETGGYTTVNFSMVREVMPWFKHEKFSAEQEFRLAIMPADVRNLKLRGGRSFLIPYHELTFDQKAIHSVIVGPCPHMQLSVQSTRYFVSKNYPGVDVVASDIPFRDW